MPRHRPTSTPSQKALKALRPGAWLQLPKLPNGTGADAITCSRSPRSVAPAPAQAFIPTTASLTVDYACIPRPLNRRRRRRSPIQPKRLMTESVPHWQSPDYERDFVQSTLFSALSSPQSLIDCGSSTRDNAGRSTTSYPPPCASEVTVEDACSPRSTTTIQDMLCNAKATVVSTPTIHSEKWSHERDNDILREYFHIRTNIVLTSSYPENVPHIVISPPQETSDDFYTAWYNRVDYQLQDIRLLSVPGYDTSRPSRMPGRSVESYWPVASGSSIVYGIPSRVWSRSRFNQQVLQTEEERLTMYQLTTALQRHRLKSVAFEASELAVALEKRYETLDVFSFIETPFRWTDPAEPILKSANWPGVMVLESSNPFITPHIMLSIAPPQDPWITYSNALQDPQDGGRGQYLVVPSRNVSFINTFNLRFDNYEDVFDDLDYSETDSPPETPEPETPTDLEESDYFPSLWQLNDDDTDDSLIYRTGPTKQVDNRNWGETQVKTEVTDLPPRPSRPIFYMDDEDEDELPPLDDWYLSVASRNGLQLSS